MPGETVVDDKMADCAAAVPGAFAHAAGEIVTDGVVEFMTPMLLVALVMAIPVLFFCRLFKGFPELGATSSDSIPRSLFSYPPAPADSPLRDPRGPGASLN